MRIFSAIILLIGINVAATAQSTVGLSANAILNFANNATVMLDNGSTYDYELTMTGPANSFAFGVNHMTHIGEAFYFHKELLYTKHVQGFTVVDYSDSDEIGDADAEIRRTDIMIPIAAGIKHKNFMFGAGPVFTIHTNNQRTENLNNIFRIENDVLSYGVQIQAGFQITPKLNLLAKYQSSFDGPIEGYYYNDKPVMVDSKLKQLSVGLNYFL